MVKMPPDTEQLTRTTGSGLEFSTLDEVKYHPTHGTVVSPPDKWQAGIARRSFTLPFQDKSNHFIGNGDEVFFSKLQWQSAKNAAFDSDNERDKGKGYESDTLAILDGDTYYMLIPYEYLNMAIRGEEIILLNDNVLCEPIPSRIVTTFFIADSREETYIENFAKVVVGSYEHPKDTLIYTKKHCNILLEEPLNNPIYSKESFIIESENIIASLMGTEIKPGVKKVLIEPIPVDEQTENSLYNMGAHTIKLQLAKVIAIGKNCASDCKPGDTIAYIRDSGQKLPSIPGVADDYEIIDDGDNNSKVFLIITETIE